MKYLKNIITNGIPLGLFIYGALTGTTWALITGVVIYWSVVVFGGFIVLVPIRLFFEQKFSYGHLRGTLYMIAKAFNKSWTYFNVIQDFIVVFIMSYFGFNILAIAYVFHIFGYLVFLHNIRTYILDRFNPEEWGTIPDRLQVALNAGQTEFSMFELMGYKHPGDEEPAEEKPERPKWWK